MKHKLKTWSVFYWDVVVGAKTFDIRINDRNFQVGDELILREYDPDNEKYTGEKHSVWVDYTVTLDGLPGIPDGLIAMSISTKDGAS